MGKETSHSPGQDHNFKKFNTSKFNHLFMSLPNPPEKTQKVLNSLFLKFIWDDKPDKISRSRLVKQYLKGRLNMVDLEKFIRALKVSWIHRLWSDDGSQWTKLIVYKLLVKSKLFLLGPSWSQSIQSKISNPIWCDRLKSWDIVNEVTHIKDFNDFMRTPPMV